MNFRFVFMEEKSLKIIIVLMTISVLGIIGIQFFWINKALKLEEERFNKSVGLALSETVKLIEKNETANVLVREISSNSGSHVMIFNKYTNKVVKQFPIDSNKLVNMVKGDTIRNDVRIEIQTDDDFDSSGVKVISESNIDCDSTAEEDIVWYSDVDSLIQKKTKNIENVFDKLLLSEQKENILDRLNREKIDSILGEEFSKYGIGSGYQFAIRIEGTDSLFFTSENQIEKKLLTTNYKVKLFPYDIFSKPNYLLVDFNNKTGVFLSSIWWVLVISIFLTLLIIFLFYQTVKMLIKQKKITELKNDLLNNITHEFKTPISTISLAADIIDASVEPKSDRYTKIIKTESNRLTNMVENILSAAALENSEYEINKERIDIHNLIRHLKEKFGLQIQSKNGKIVLHLDAANPYLNLDRQQIFNSINNIIDNAIKYNSSQPEIHITTIDRNNAFEIVIEDNGIGIEVKNYSKIFETFFRVPTGNIHNVKGNGIGLSYVKKIIKAHGGTVLVQSEINKGSKFIINLPKY